jgi:hypothetical protein
MSGVEQVLPDPSGGRGRRRSILIAGGAVFLVSLELAAYKLRGTAAVIASRIWALHGLLFLGRASALSSP